MGKGCYSVTDLLSLRFHFEERESVLLQAYKPGVTVDTSDGTH